MNNTENNYNTENSNIKNNIENNIENNETLRVGDDAKISEIDEMQAADGDFDDDIAGRKQAQELREAKKMKIRKVLYPIAIILIVAIWVSCFLEK